MQCHEFETRLNELLDERHAPEGDEQLTAHAARCEACGRLLAGHGAVYAGLAAIAGPAPRADFARVVVAQFAAEAANPPSPAARRGNRLWWVLGTLAATAAGLLLMVGVAQRVRDRREKLANDRPEVVSPEREKPPARPRGLAVATPGLTKPKNAAPRPPVTGGPLAGGPVLGLNRPFAAYGLSLENMAATLPETVERLEEMEQVSPGFRPLRVSFAVLFDALRWAIPGLHRPPSQPQRTSSQLLDSWRLA
jgi:hypothetical protein